MKTEAFEEVGKTVKRVCEHHGWTPEGFNLDPSDIYANRKVVEVKNGEHAPDVEMLLDEGWVLMHDLSGTHITDERDDSDFFKS